MRSKFSISASERAAIKADWLAGHSINKICATYNHGTEQIRGLADRECWPPRGPRDPLPAGHALTWGALWAGQPPRFPCQPARL